MGSQFIYIAIFFGVFYALYFGFLQLKKKKQKELTENTDFARELNNAASHKRAYLESDLPYLVEQMKGKPIDALNFANINYTTKDSIKDGLKDGLKGMATLGTVKFHTVQTPKYLILSGSDLHLLDTDTDGDFSNHLIFNAERLEKSSLREITLDGTLKGFAKQKGEHTKAYRISLSTDADPIELIIFSALIFTYANTGTSAFSLNSEKQLQEIIIGNDFLKKLGEKYPNLSVPLPILS